MFILFYSEKIIFNSNTVAKYLKIIYNSRRIGIFKLFLIFGGIRLMEKKEMLYEGKAKKVFATEDPALCIVSYKDDATAFNGEKKGTIVGKGVVNNRMSNFMFKLLEKNGVPTDFVEELSDRDTVLKKVQIVPLEVIVRNKAAGSFSKRFGVPEGTAFKAPTLEYCL